MTGENTFNKKMEKPNNFLIYLSKNINIHKRKTTPQDFISLLILATQTGIYKSYIEPFIFCLNVNYYIFHRGKNESVSTSV